MLVCCAPDMRVRPGELEAIFVVRRHFQVSTGAGKLWSYRMWLHLPYLSFLLTSPRRPIAGQRGDLVFCGKRARIEKR